MFGTFIIGVMTMAVSNGGADSPLALINTDGFFFSQYLSCQA